MPAELEAVEHIDDLIPALVLGALDSGEEQSAREHLAGCPRCAAEYQAYAVISNKLSLAAPQVTPPQGLRASILSSARKTAPVVRKRPTWREDLAVFFSRPGSLWMAASLAVILLLALGNVYQWRTRQIPVSTPAVHFNVVAMRSDNQAASAEGVLIISPDGRYGTLVVNGLQPLVADQVYQVWLILGDSRVSGGLFSVGASGYGAMEVESPRPLSEYTRFGITIEPLGGSPQPTGERVLGGDL